MKSLVCVNSLFRTSSTSTIAAIEGCYNSNPKTWRVLKEPFHKNEMVPGNIYMQAVQHAFDPNSFNEPTVFYNSVQIDAFRSGFNEDPKAMQYREFMTFLYNRLPGLCAHKSVVFSNIPKHTTSFNEGTIFTTRRFKTFFRSARERHMTRTFFSTKFLGSIFHPDNIYPFNKIRDKLMSVHKRDFDIVCTTMAWLMHTYNCFNYENLGMTIVSDTKDEKNEEVAHFIRSYLGKEVQGTLEQELVDPQLESTKKNFAYVSRDKNPDSNMHWKPKGKREHTSQETEEMAPILRSILEPYNSDVFEKVLTLI